ncbi:hypothetical protein CDL15_Pgr004515 [Punica granatum]|uniref:Uncharacterized protein n=1 Tax=Punica granatum TaxID=22663 RepID=A0A218X038_PUNGR|nr:hypothetical protein CDL15_Pgr004515 [Punica granatum]PKI68895.1 hypothetical protein CRG98_010750 [Punica granatum]
MHVRGARRMGRAVGVHGRRAGGVRRAGRATDVRGHAVRVAVLGRGVCVAVRGHAARRAGVLASGSVWLRVHCSLESTSFSRNDGIDLKS